jgi:hypothetical protein
MFGKFKFILNKKFIIKFNFEVKTSEFIDFIKKIGFPSNRYTELDHFCLLILHPDQDVEELI